MDLKQWLESLPFLKVFSAPEDEQKVQDLMSTAPMKVGGLELVYDRSPEFQRLLQYQGAEYLTVLGKSPKGELMGLFSLSFTKKWVSGIPRRCGYIGDFRVAPSRQAAVAWRKSYPEILKRLQQESDDPVYFLTAILKKNAEAQRALVNPKKDLGFYYRQIQDLDMVNVYARLPLPKKSGYKVFRATPDDETSLREFLHQNEKNKDFGSLFDKGPDDAWSFRSLHWPDFKIQNFLVLKDQNGKIVACTMPWNPSKAKRMTIRRAPRSLRMFFSVLRAFGLRLPSVGESLSTYYLTHFCTSSEINLKETRSAFLHWCFEHIKDATMFSYAAASSCDQLPTGFIQQKVGVLLYTVSTQPDAQPFKSEIGFEMGLV